MLLCLANRLYLSILCVAGVRVEWKTFMVASRCLVLRLGIAGSGLGETASQDTRNLCLGHSMQNRLFVVPTDHKLAIHPAAAVSRM